MLRNLNKFDRIFLNVVARTHNTRRLPAWVGFVVATVLVTIATLIRIYIEGGLHEKVFDLAFLPYFLIILFCALIFDRYAGLWVTVLAALAAAATVGPIPNSVALRINLLPTLAFMITGFTISFVVEALNHLYDKHRLAFERSNMLILDINHRVKNHLGVIAGLMNMSKKKVTDKTGLDAIDTIQGRILVLARLYDRLLLDDENATVTVNTRGFIHPLCDDLRSGVIGDIPVIVECQVDDATIETATAVPVGLLINELVTNSIKHAFDHDEGGIINISLRDRGQEFVLTVSDDGTGGPPCKGTGQNETAGTGARLIKSLTQQLNGTYKVDVSNGRTTTITFPHS